MRVRIKYPWLLVPTFVIVFVSGIVLLKISEVNQLYIKPIVSTVPSVVSLPTLKHVTKSLAELGPMDELNSHVLFFNRIPKSGSEVLVLLIQWLEGWNSFRHVRLKNGIKRKLIRSEQEELVYEITDVIRNRAVPLSFDKHVYFVNFSSFDRQSPTFINLLRDPVDKLIASYTALNFKDSVSSTKIKRNESIEECIKKKRSRCALTNGKPYDLTIPYFCGQDDRCMLLNNAWALQQAKLNVERYFTVVGVLEEFNTTLEVFESKVPYFFKGVQNLYLRDLFQPHIKRNRKKLKVDEHTKIYLKNTLKCEYEFYDWIKSRLFGQLQVIYGEHNSH